MHDEWEGAENMEVKEDEIKTTNLVYWLGEKEVSLLHARRIIANQKKGILALRLKIESTGKDEKEQRSIVIESLRANIRNLEEKLHAVALERDDYKNELLSLKKSLEAKKEKKGKKKNKELKEIDGSDSKV